jgi:hypothetical protein
MFLELKSDFLQVLVRYTHLLASYFFPAETNAVVKFEQ